MIFSFSGTAALEEDAQILKVIEAYCTSAKTRQTLNSSKKFLSLPHTCVHRRGKASQWCLQELSLFSAVYRSLTQKFLTAPSNRIFSFCLSSTPRSFAFFFWFPLSFVLIFVFYSPIFNHNFLSSSHHASITAFMIYDLLPTPTPLRTVLSSCSTTIPHPHICFHHGLPRAAWQGTDLMHNHVLADVDRSCADSPGRRSSVSRPELSSDLSEDSDYDSIWTSHSYRMGSVPRKSCISHQN